MAVLRGGNSEKTREEKLKDMALGLAEGSKPSFAVNAAICAVKDLEDITLAVSLLDKAIRGYGDGNDPGAQIKSVAYSSRIVALESLRSAFFGSRNIHEAIRQAESFEASGIVDWL